jgi:cardiolipin synthase
VAVSVVVAGHNDIAIVAKASRGLYGELLASGVRLFEWPEGMLHAKTAVIDDAWAAVGSYNLDHRSLMHNLEVVVSVADSRFTRLLRERNMEDIARCHEVTLLEHEARPWREMLLESLALSLRYWL